MRNDAFNAGKRCARALLWCLAATLATGGANAQSLAARAKDTGCIDAPRVVVEGATFTYRCKTASGSDAYFNGPPSNAPASQRGGFSKSTPTPPGFPKVDAETQRTRDDMRRKVLADELSAEEKLLADARKLYASGAPTPLPEEQANAAKYQERIARLRQSVLLHERNIEALKKELASTR